MKTTDHRAKAEAMLKRAGYACGGMPMAKAIEHGHGRNVYARGGATKSGHKSTHVNVIVAPQGGGGGGGPPPGLPIARPPMAGPPMGGPPPGAMPPGAGPPRPPMAPPGGMPPPGLGGAPPGGPPPMPPGGPPMMQRKRGGGIKYPITGGAGGGLARLEMAKLYAKKR